MKSKKTLILLLVLFVVLLGGAWLLYNRLGSDLAPGQLTAQSTSEASDDSGDPVSSSSFDFSESSGSSEDSDSGKTPAPDFTVYDPSGNEVCLSDYIGKPVILNFWASWCGPCKMEMPDFQKKYQELGSEIQFLMINMTDGSRETADSASTFISEQGYTFPVFYDTDSDAAIAYGAYSLPATYFIDAEGNAVARAIGAIDAKTLQAGIDMIYSSSEVSPET